jgi:hypothetical protein
VCCRGRPSPYQQSLHSISYSSGEFQLAPSESCSSDKEHHQAGRDVLAGVAGLGSESASVRVVASDNLGSYFAAADAAVAEASAVAAVVSPRG